LWARAGVFLKGAKEKPLTGWLGLFVGVQLSKHFLSWIKSCPGGVKILVLQRTSDSRWKFIRSEFQLHDFCITKGMRTHSLIQRRKHNEVEKTAGHDVNVGSIRIHDFGRL
jgi:hypothetical protein